MLLLLHNLLVTGVYLQMAVPCYMKYYNSYCYLEKNKDTCTFYSAPSYA